MCHIRRKQFYTFVILNHFCYTRKPGLICNAWGCCEGTGEIKKLILDHGIIYFNITFFFNASGVELCPLYCGHFWPIVPAPDDRWGRLWSSWWNEDWQGKPKYSEKTRPAPLLHKSSQMVPILSQINPVHTTLSYLYNFNIIHPLTCWSS
jgi:hypothetical protein